MNRTSLKSGVTDDNKVLLIFRHQRSAYGLQQNQYTVVVIPRYRMTNTCDILLDCRGVNFLECAISVRHTTDTQCAHSIVLNDPFGLWCGPWFSVPQQREGIRSYRRRGYPIAILVADVNSEDFTAWRVLGESKWNKHLPMGWECSNSSVLDENNSFHLSFIRACGDAKQLQHF